jgi:RIO kinase 2
MKLDPTVMRTMERSDFRVLEAVEKGMKDHYVVPFALINSIARLRHGGSHKIISSLLRDKLLSHEVKKGMDGYRLTNSGYDVLALHYLKSKGIVVALGQRIGTGKESDIYLAVNPNGQQIVLKFHRLGRTSFRNVRQKRDYQQNKNSAHSWLFLSRLSALKEYAFLTALYNVQYPTPTPIAQNRHIVAMSVVRGMPLYQIHPSKISHAQAVDMYEQVMTIAKRLAQIHGLVHCDFNEFNLLVDLSGGVQTQATDDRHDGYVRHSGQSVYRPIDEQSIGALSKPIWEQRLLEEQQQEQHKALENDVNPDPLPEPIARLSTGEPKPVVTLIDFPQMISVNHVNAKEYYERDMACLKRFFMHKLNCHILKEDNDDDEDNDEWLWENVMGKYSAVVNPEEDGQRQQQQQRLDEHLRASGFGADVQGNKDLELYYFQSGPQRIASAIDEEEEVEDESNGEYVDLDDDYEENFHDSNSLSSHESEPLEKEREPFNDIKVLDPEGHDLLSAEDEIELEPSDSVARIVNTTKIQSVSREKLEEFARARVLRQMEEQRRKTQKKGVFRRGNSSKTNIKKNERLISGSLF